MTVHTEKIQPIPKQETNALDGFVPIQQIGSGRPSVFVATTSPLLSFPHNVNPLHFSKEHISLIKPFFFF